MNTECIEHNKEKNHKKVSWYQRILVGGNIKFTFIRILILIILVVITNKYIIFPIRCDGISMEPNYLDQSIHLVYKLAYEFSDPQRGDVIAIRIPGGNAMLMKRIIGLPGESVDIRHGTVFINNTPLEEPWMEHVNRFPWERKAIILQPNEYFVIGDNRTMPMELHVHGEVKKERILGKIIK